MSSGAWCHCTFTILVLGFFATFIAWVYFIPTIPSFSVDEASISGDNLSLHVTAYNPNSHYRIRYHVVMVSVYDNSTLWAYEVLGPFSHHPKAHLVLKVGPLAHNGTLTSDADDLEVRVRAVTQFRIKGWRKLNFTLRAVRSNLKPYFNSSKDPSGAHPTPCLVDGFRFF